MTPRYIVALALRTARAEFTASQVMKQHHISKHTFDRVRQMLGAEIQTETMPHCEAVYRFKKG